jgi:hypothetical protein
VYLQVTNDGGESWVTFDGHGDFIEAPNTVSENGFTTTVDISCMAAGESNVQIRFSYLQAPETGEGYSHYFWGIDDVMIFEAPVNNDLEVLQVTNGDVSEGWELAVTPMEQLPQIENGGVLTGVMFRNVGNLDQTDVELQVEVLDMDGNLLESVTQNVGLVPANANSEQCPIHPSDTSYVPTNWVPEEIGVYELRVTVSSDAEDELPMNNVYSRMIEFSEAQMGHDMSLCLQILIFLDYSILQDMGTILRWRIQGRLYTVWPSSLGQIRVEVYWSLRRDCTKYRAQSNWRMRFWLQRAGFLITTGHLPN